MFTLEWLRDPELRRRVLAGLNRGEALHALKRAVAFHRSSEIQDRSFEAQRTGPVALVTTAIAVWNTMYLGRVVEALRTEGVDMPDELLAHVSPLGWEHIGLTGDYVWLPEGVPTDGAYRSLRETPSRTGFFLSVVPFLNLVLAPSRLKLRT